MIVIWLKILELLGFRFKKTKCISSIFIVQRYVGRYKENGEKKRKKETEN